MKTRSRHRVYDNVHALFFVYLQAYVLVNESPNNSMASYNNSKKKSPDSITLTFEKAC